MILIIIFFIKNIISLPSCKSYYNYCQTCNPKTNLCQKCEKQEILIPDENGGCIGSKICQVGKNYCLECDSDGKLCNSCDSGYAPDENGGCSYSNYCEISYNGECLKCKENYILIGQQYNFKICKSIFSNDFQNCKTINSEKGYCEECETGFYLNNGDKKCTKVERCNESIFGNCIKCNRGYYFDIKENLCKKQEKQFLHCKQTIDGRTCDICDDETFFDENRNCSFSNYCSNSSNGKCQKCINGYYLTNNSLCSESENCYSSDSESGVCLKCIDNYYLDTYDYKCKSNIINKEYQFCKQVDNGKCVICELYYNLDEENKCCDVFNCAKSENGKCILCSDNYYLGLDNYCSNVEHCIYSKSNQCIECEDNYYYDKPNKKCLEAKNDFYGCKISNDEGNSCFECKNNYYLRKNDSLCFDNNDSQYYKCSFTDYNGMNCSKCIEGYYLGSEDKKCSLINNCAISNNENECLKCQKGYCLDLNTSSCISNEKIEDINKKFYFSCNKTNKEGTACEQCIEGYELNEEGYCVDLENCEELKDGICTKCKETNKWIGFCANIIFNCN